MKSSCALLGACVLSACQPEAQSTTDTKFSVPARILQTRAVDRDQLRPKVMLSNGTEITMQKVGDDTWSGTINVQPNRPYFVTVNWIETLPKGDLLLATWSDTINVDADGTEVNVVTSDYDYGADFDNDNITNLQERENDSDPFEYTPNTDANGDDGGTSDVDGSSDADGTAGQIDSGTTTDASDGESTVGSDDTAGQTTGTVDEGITDSGGTTDSDGTAGQTDTDTGTTTDASDGEGTVGSDDTAGQTTGTVDEGITDSGGSTDSDGTAGQTDAGTTTGGDDDGNATDGTTASGTTGTTAGTTASGTTGTTAGTTANGTTGATAGTTAGTTAGATAGVTAGTTAGNTAGTTAGTAGGTTGGNETTAQVVIPRILPSQAPEIDGEGAVLNNQNTLTGEWADAVQFDDFGAGLWINHLMINNDTNTVDPAVDGDELHRWAAMHDGINLYVLVLSDDDGQRHSDSESVWRDDAIEVFIDGNNSQLESYGDADDFHYMIALQQKDSNKATTELTTERVVIGPSPVSEPFDIILSTGPGEGPRGTRRPRFEQDVYELSIPIADAGITIGELFGFEIQLDDDDNDAGRDSKWGWAHPSRENDINVDLTYQNPSIMGRVVLEE